MTSDRASTDCDHANHYFDRSICYCDTMHYRCKDCGAQVDECEPVTLRMGLTNDQ